MNHNNSRQNGFTIVELMIAMAFIALLLLAIAATVIQIGAIYNKGVTMKSVNQAGRLIVRDMKQVIGQSAPFDTQVAYKPHERSLGSIDYDGAVLCTGVYSYIWNIGNTDTAGSQYYKYTGSDSDKILRLVRIRDTGEFCKADAPNTISYAKATELLSGSGGNLAVQNFHIDRLTNSTSTGMALYSVRISISDANQDAVETNIDTLDTTCRAPKSSSVDQAASGFADQDYCAVNEFMFTAKAGNKGESNG